MIIYERDQELIMITQHHHGLLSGDLVRKWNPAYVMETERWEEVLYAIAQHDCAWIDLDETPFWNDRTGKPYSFIDFPPKIRLTYYQKGIEEIEKNSLYAGLLCSLHYHSFLIGSKEPRAIEFLNQEKARQIRLKKQMNLVGAQQVSELKEHFLLLQFCDNLSLYLCMQEPGTPKEEEFPWFKDGFPEIFTFAGGQKILAEWHDKKRAALNPFPLSCPAEITVPVKEVKKAAISQKGIAKAYRETEWKTRTLTLIPKK